MHQVLHPLAGLCICLQLDQAAKIGHALCQATTAKRVVIQESVTNSMPAKTASGCLHLSCRHVDHGFVHPSCYSNIT